MVRERPLTHPSGTSAASVSAPMAPRPIFIETPEPILVAVDAPMQRNKPVERSAQTPEAAGRLPEQFHLDSEASSLDVITMRTIVDLPVDQIAALDAYTKAEGISRAEAVRRAVAAFVPVAGKTKRSLREHPAFGLMRHKKIDSVAATRKMRSEWDHRL